MLMRKFSGWEEAAAEDYKLCYFQYGGNFSTHPDVLDYIHRHACCSEKYYIHHKSGKINGAVCVWDNNTLANDISTYSVTSHLCIPVARDELILPLTHERNIFIPFKSKIISPLNSNIINRNTLFNARRTICLARPLTSFARKKVKKLNGAVRKFLREGGEIRDQSEFSAQDIVEMYASLFEKRRGKKLASRQETLDFTLSFRKHFYGKILFFNNTPCAFMQITKCESKNIIALDFINIGIDTAINTYSPGSILMWININEAYNTLTSEGKKIRFSFGRPTSEYKKRWCYQEKLARLL